MLKESKLTLQLKLVVTCGKELYVLCTYYYDNKTTRIYLLCLSATLYVNQVSTSSVNCEESSLFHIILIPTSSWPGTIGRSVKEDTLLQLEHP